MRCSRKVLVIMMLLTCMICSCSSNCNDKMAETKRKYGPPEEVNTYSNSGYNSTSWWYWTKGIEFTFTWGDGVSGCEVSTFTFDPIGGVVTDTARDLARETKVLESTLCYPNSRICD